MDAHKKRPIAAGCEAPWWRTRPHLLQTRRSWFEADDIFPTPRWPHSEPYRCEDCTLVAWYRWFTHLAREGRM